MKWVRPRGGSWGPPGSVSVEIWCAQDGWSEKISNNRVLSKNDIPSPLRREQPHDVGERPPGALAGDGGAGDDGGEDGGVRAAAPTTSLAPADAPGKSRGSTGDIRVDPLRPSADGGGASSPWTLLIGVRLNGVIPAPAWQIADGDSF